MLKSWRCMCTNVCPWPLCRQSQSEKKKIKNCGVVSLKMAQGAHDHMQPILFLSTDMDQNEIVLNKIWVFIRLYWQGKSVKSLIGYFRRKLLGSNLHLITIIYLRCDDHFTRIKLLWRLRFKSPNRSFLYVYT